VVELLLENGADKNAEHMHVWAPLFLVVEYEHEGVVRLLLKDGIDGDLV
jgi:hypothetical protein